jgi:aspartate aminotransferase-like enzyme
MMQDHEIVLGGGQQKLDGQIFRIGHLGLAPEKDITAVISGLRESLPKVGFSVS